MKKEELYRRIPNMNQFLEEPRMRELADAYGRVLVKDAAVEVLDCIKASIKEGREEEDILYRLHNLPDLVEEKTQEKFIPHLKHVINGTGILLHTNLGRACVGEEIYDRVRPVVCGFSNLEYNLAGHKRGERYAHFEELLINLTGAEAAIAVNNNASSVLLILSALSKGGEAIISRGELIEIGGKFRIPDVMEESGTRLVEVGTTNRTRAMDYKEAICEDTRLILKVHTSNYKIIGFTESADGRELAALAKEKEIPFVEDLGSGVLVNLEDFGLPHERTVQEALAEGADLVCFSGDKLLGGCQAGIIVGRKAYIEKLKKHPLIRALRIDKFTAAVLEETLMQYQNPERLIREIPLYRMLSQSMDTLKKRGNRIRRRLKNRMADMDCSLIPCRAQVGGGSLPAFELDSMGIAVKPKDLSVSELENRLRTDRYPVLGILRQDQLVFDLRTVKPEEEEALVEAIERAVKKGTQH